MADAYRRTDEELVEDYLAGDVGAFREVIERYHDPLINFLYRLTGDRQTAEDVFQETFLQVHHSLETFDTSRTFKPWLFTIAANKGRDELRKRQRRQALSLSAPVSSEGRESFVDLMALDLPGPETGLETEETSRMVQAAVDAMPPRLREILLLAYFQKMTYQQIAELFDIPLGTVKSRLHSAVAAFAKQWQTQVDAREREASEKRASRSSRGTSEPG